jgi:hypothetical protein
MDRDFGEDAHVISAHAIRGLDPRIHLSSQKWLLKADGLPGQARQ